MPFRRCKYNTSPINDLNPAVTICKDERNRTMTTSAERLYFIDWIRIGAFLLLILFHATLPFTVFPWELKDKAHSDILSSIVWWLHQWRLPVLFFVSGVGVQLSLRRRSIGAFAAERFVRLFIPLLFAMFFILPVQVYIEFLQQGRITGSYLRFYPSVWSLVPYPEGSLTWSHLWFVVYLIAFLILLLPVFALARTKVLKPYRQALAAFMAKPLPTILMLLPLFGIYHRLALQYPQTGGLIGDWFVLAFSLALFLFGWLVGDQPAFWEACQRHRKRYGLIAAACTLGMFIFYWWPLRLPETQGLRFTAYALVNCTLIWFTLLAILGFARQYANRDSSLRRYLSAAVFPFYIIHQAIIVATGYGIVQTGWPMPFKLTVLITLSFVLIFLLYEGLIRRTAITRVLFGMKLNRRTHSSSAHASESER